MNTLFDAVGAWTPVIVVAFVLAEVLTLVVAVLWRRRGEAALRRHDYELGEQYLEEVPAFMHITGFIAVLPVVHGGAVLMSLALTGTARLPSEAAGSMNAVTTGLVGITAIAVALQLAEVKFRRYIAGARALDEHQKGADRCCTFSP